MAWLNLRAELEEEFSGYQRQDNEFVAQLVPVTWVKRLREQKERDASIPETNAPAPPSPRKTRGRISPWTTLSFWI